MAQTPASERVWRRISKAGPDECWLWTGARPSRRTKSGGQYGHLGGDGRTTVYAHRVVYESVVGPIPDGYEIDHLCKQTLCCNPKHLQAVAPRDNNMRSDSCAALNAVKTHCPRGHEYNEENTGYRSPSVKKMGPNGRPWRYCRACAREDMRRRRGYEPSRFRT